MSYCRWSSDNFQCDLYVYGDVHGGIMINVAGKRYTTNPNEAPPHAKIEEHLAWCDANMEKIDLPHAGEWFKVADEKDAIAKLMELREIGYRFPGYVIERLREEVSDAR